ncbi:MAG TPA: ATP-binding protein [Bacillota bacterium]|nr:ATP-binding protein [Bacillota bacterium]
MFWRSVVGKLAVTILLLVSFVLFILTILLLEFFKDFHIEEAEEEMMQTATNAAKMVDEYEDRDILLDSIELIKEPLSGIAIVFDDDVWYSKGKNGNLFANHTDWVINNPDFQHVINEKEEMQKEMTFPESDIEGMVVGTPIKNGKGAVFVYQTLDVIHQTKAQTTKIIFHAAGIAIILTVIFAFFLSTRITSPLIKMREAAFELARGEFNTKVPILTHDEIGELAIAFNRMGRQLKFHINALHQEKEQLSGIVSSMADGVITINRTGNVIVTNSPAKRFIDDWYFENNISPPTNENEYKLPEDLIKIFQTVIDGEKEVLREVNLQGRSWVMIMTPLYDRSFVRGAVAVIRDMTEERQMDKLRKDFIANVSHELRTPISLLQGYSEAIVDDIAESPQEKNELAQIIYEESLRLSRLVNELLDLARMEAGHIQLNLEMVNVENYISRVIRKFSGAAEKNHIDLKVTKDIQKQEFMFDQDRIEQVLTNLIDNAIRHTSDGGEVNVHIKSEDKSLSIDIKDSGAGIPEEDIPFVFDRFYKADKSRTRNKTKKGTGLGLAIAKNIIDAHHGTITVKSKLNQGTTFSFTIPLN